MFGGLSPPIGRSSTRWQLTLDFLQAGQGSICAVVTMPCYSGTKQQLCVISRRNLSDLGCGMPQFLGGSLGLGWASELLNLKHLLGTVNSFCFCHGHTLSTSTLHVLCIMHSVYYSHDTEQKGQGDLQHRWPQRQLSPA